MLINAVINSQIYKKGRKFEFVINIKKGYERTTGLTN